MRKKGSELVIHITIFGAISFLFYCIIFPHLQFTAWEFKTFTAGDFENFTVQTVPPVLILANHNLFVSLVFVGFLFVVC